MVGRPRSGDRKKSSYDAMDWDELKQVLGKEPKHIRITMKGKTYAALDLSYWDPEVKQGRHRRKIIGFYNDSGEYVETGSKEDSRPKVTARRNTAETLEIGTDLLFRTISDDVGLTSSLRYAYPRDWSLILSCAFFMLSEGKAMSRCEQWSAGCRHPYGCRIGDQRISELFKRLNCDSQKEFFIEWVKRIGLEDNYAFDITSISSYSEEITSVRAGYNRDGENLEQINLGMMIGSETYLPAYYTLLPGNINDRASLNAFLKILNKMKFRRYKLVMDKGFCTIDNIDLMYRMKVRFTISLTLSLKFAKEAISDAKAELTNPDNLRQIMGSTVYRTTSLRKWSVDGTDHRCYTHVYYDSTKREGENQRFEKRLLKVRELLDSGMKLSDGDQEFADRYFLRRTWGDKVEWKTNMEAVGEFRSREMGYLVIISNHEKDPDEALKIYRCKETAEQSFDDLKNGEDLRRMRVHSEGGMDGKMFVAFISLIILMRIRLIKSALPELRERSTGELIDEMKLLRQVTLGNRKSPIFTARTKLQKQIIKAFSIDADFNDDSACEGE